MILFQIIRYILQLENQRRIEDKHAESPAPIFDSASE